MIAICIGCTRAGKSTLARSIVKRWAARSRKRVLIVDCEADKRLARYPRTTRVEELPRLLAEHPVVAFDQMHAGKAELARLPRFIEAAGNLVLWVDGAHAVLGAQTKRDDPWLRLMRVHGHAELDEVWTTHHLGSDVSQSAQAFAPTLYVFRVTSPAALDVLEREFGLEREKIRNLERGNFVRVQLGFEDDR